MKPSTTAYILLIQSLLLCSCFGEQHEPTTSTSEEEEDIIPLDIMWKLQYDFDYIDCPYDYSYALDIVRKISKDSWSGGGMGVGGIQLSRAIIALADGNITKMNILYNLGGECNGDPRDCLLSGNRAGASHCGMDPFPIGPDDDDPLSPPTRKCQLREGETLRSRRDCESSTRNHHSDHPLPSEHYRLPYGRYQFNFPTGVYPNGTEFNDEEIEIFKSACNEMKGNFASFSGTINCHTWYFQEENFSYFNIPECFAPGEDCDVYYESIDLWFIDWQAIFSNECIVHQSSSQSTSSPSKSSTEVSPAMNATSSSGTNAYMYDQQGWNWVSSPSRHNITTLVYVASIIAICIFTSVLVFWFNKRRERQRKLYLHHGLQCDDVQHLELRDFRCDDDPYSDKITNNNLYCGNVDVVHGSMK